MDINAIIQLISLAISAGTNLVLAFKHNADGTVDISVTQTQTQTNLATDLAQAAAWFASKQPTSIAPAGGATK